MTADQTLVAHAISDGPAWALVGLTMPDSNLRERGAEELARWIAARIDPQQPIDRRRLGLPF